jgi:hypothetical protein
MRLALEADAAARRQEAEVLTLPAATDTSALTMWGTLWSALSERRTRPSADVTAIIMAAATGRLERLAVGPDGYLTAVGPLANFPANAAVLDLGAHDGQLISLVTGERWRDVAPPAGAPPLDGVTQVARRVTTSSSPRQLSGVLRLHLARHAGRVGLVAQRHLLNAVWRQLSATEHGRVGRCRWYGTADDLSDCDLVLALGMPQPHRQAVFRRLVQADDPAAFADPEWGEGEFWEGTGADGNRVLLRRVGYGNERWQEVSRELAMGVLRRLLGRLSCPVVVVTDERLDVPLDGGDGGAVLPPETARVLAALRQESLVAPPAPVVVPLRAVATGVLAEAVGRSLRAVQLNLAALEARGLAAREGARKGWTPGREPRDGDIGGLPTGCGEVLAALCRLAEEAIAHPGLSETKTPTWLPSNQGGEEGVKEEHVVGDLVASGPDAQSGRPPTPVSTGRLAEQTGLSGRVVRRHLDRLLDLGFAYRTGQGHKVRWTPSALALPAAVADPTADAAYREVHVAPERDTAAAGESRRQRSLPFETGALRERLGGVEPAPLPLYTRTAHPA